MGVQGAVSTREQVHAVRERLHAVPADMRVGSRRRCLLRVLTTRRDRSAIGRLMKVGGACVVRMFVSARRSDGVGV